MRSLVSLSTSLITGLTLLMVACSSSSNGLGPVPDQESTDTTDASTSGGGACNLQQSGLAFASAACTTCMQASCCAQTVTCVQTDPSCASLQSCLLACPVPNNDGGGGGTGATAKACIAACNTQYPSAQTDQTAYQTCLSTSCGTECTQ